MTPTDAIPETIDAELRTAGGRNRVNFDAPPAPPEPRAEAPAEDTPPAPVDIPDDELDALLLDRSTRRETLADPEVRIRLAMRDPELRAEIERREERVRVAEETAQRRMEAAAGPKPTPLPGGGAAPVPHGPPSQESILRAAVMAAKGEPIPHQLRPFVRPATDVTVTGFSPQ